MVDSSLVSRGGGPHDDVSKRWEDAADQGDVLVRSCLGRAGAIGVSLRVPDEVGVDAWMTSRVALLGAEKSTSINSHQQSWSGARAALYTPSSPSPSSAAMVP